MREKHALGDTCHGLDNQKSQNDTEQSRPLFKARQPEIEPKRNVMICRFTMVYELSKRLPPPNNT